MKGYPERRGEDGWDFARNIEILAHHRRREMAQSFRGGGWWQGWLRRSWCVVTRYLPSRRTHSVLQAPKGHICMTNENFALYYGHVIHKFTT